MRLAGRVLTRGADGTDMPDGIKPPKRGPATEPLQLSTVFRGVQVLQTAITGLPIVEQRGGRDLPDVSPMVLQPDVSRSRRDFIADIVASLVLDGNAFTRIVRDWKGEIVTCEMLPPQYVTVTDESDDPACPDLRFSYLGHAYTADDVVHSKFLNVPGRLRGLGPISAAREEIEAAQLARDYKAKFFTDGSNLKGYLRTSENITQEAAQQAKASWKASGEAGDIKVVGKNLEYVPLDMKPADLQFLETQKFDTTQIARLLGIPASIMLAAVDGSNLSLDAVHHARRCPADDRAQRLRLGCVHRRRARLAQTHLCGGARHAQRAGEGVAPRPVDALVGRCRVFMVTARASLWTGTGPHIAICCPLPRPGRLCGPGRRMACRAARRTPVGAVVRGAAGRAGRHRPMGGAV